MDRAKKKGRGALSAFPQRSAEESQEDANGGNKLGETDASLKVKRRTLSQEMHVSQRDNAVPTRRVWITRQ